LSKNNPLMQGKSLWFLVSTFNRMKYYIEKSTI
jgi:hypothetical protein